MPIFAIAAEGTTDHLVLENILLGFCREHGLEADDVRPIQPPVDQTSKQTGQGGWKAVLGWLREKRYHDAFLVADHLVVHIDTYESNETHFDVPHALPGEVFSVAGLVRRVREKFEGIIGPDDLSLYQGRFHFAISVHSIECWLLPLWGWEEEHSHPYACKHKVDLGLGRAKLAGLHKDRPSTYRQASGDFRKRKELLKCAKHQESLSAFLASLEGACLSPPA